MLQKECLLHDEDDKDRVEGLKGPAALFTKSDFLLKLLSGLKGFGHQDLASGVSIQLCKIG